MMVFNEEKLNKIIQSMYLDKKPSQIDLEWFKSQVGSAINENKELLNQPGRMEEYKALMAIIDSDEFKKLEGKTQVVPRIVCGEKVSTRFTHTAQVFWISYRTAEALGLDPLKTGIMALCHDLGHTPFGHYGETELDRIIKSTKNGDGLAFLLKEQGIDHLSFEEFDEFLHEKYSVILFERLFRDKKLNLSPQTRKDIIDGILLHGGKFGRAGSNEGKIISYADKIAYLAQDYLDMETLYNKVKLRVEKEQISGDIINTNYLNNIKLLGNALTGIPTNLGETPQKRREAMLKSLILSSDEHNISMNERVVEGIEDLKKHMYENVYRAELVGRIERRMYKAIFVSFIEALKEVNAKREAVNTKEGSKVLNRIVLMTDEQVIKITKEVLNPLRFYRWEALENPLVDKELIEKNRDKVSNYTEAQYVDEMFKLGL